MLYRAEKEITLEQYQRAKDHNGYLTKEDYLIVYTDAERYGYGVYGGSVHERDGRYFVSYKTSDSCD